MTTKIVISPPTIDTMFAHPKIKWSNFKNVTIPQSDIRETVRQGILRTNNQNQVLQVILALYPGLSKNQLLEIHFWQTHYVYLEVIDSTWKHYPCGYRALVTFDLNEGRLSRESDLRHYVFARKGWQKRIEELIEEPVKHYLDCGDRTKTKNC